MTERVLLCCGSAVLGVSEDSRIVSIVREWMEVEAARRLLAERSRPRLKLRRYSPRYRLVRDRFCDPDFLDD